MSVAYVDSSAIVKLYADEQHHQHVRAINGPLITSALARVEVSAAFYGKARSGEVPIGAARTLDTVFAIDWDEGRFLHVASDAEIEREAAALCARYALRGFDAVHLATANAVRRTVADCDFFVCFDRKLNEAAAGEQFRLLATT